MKELIKDYPKFWAKRTHDENGNRLCKYPFVQWMITAMTVAMLTVFIASLTSCASSNYYKGCDGKKKFKTQM